MEQKRHSVSQERKLSQTGESLGARIAPEVKFTGGIALLNVVDFGAEECLIARVSPDAGVYAAGLSNGSIAICSTDSCKPVKSLDLPKDSERQSVTGLAFLPPASPEATEKLLLASYAAGQVRLWQYNGESETPRWTFQEEELAAHDGSAKTTGKPSQILCFASSFDCQRFVTGGVDGAIRVYNLQDRSLLTICQSSQTSNKVDGHRNRVCALLYHPLGQQYPNQFGRIFLSGGWDKTVQIWDDRHPRSLWAYFGPHICGSDAIDVDPLQNLVLTSSWERQKPLLQVWSYPENLHANAERNDEKMLKGRPLGELQQDPFSAPSMGYVAQWLGDQCMIFGGCNANAFKIMDRRNLATVGSVDNLPAGVCTMAAFSPDAGDSKRQNYRLAVGAGTRMYVLRFDRR